MFDKIKNEYKDNLLKSFNDSDWVFFKYIIESVPEIMLAYRNKDGDLQLNKDYIALLALLVVALGPSRELILNMKHAKSLRELYDIVADDAQYATRIGPPSLKLLQLLVSDTWPQLAELFTDDKSTRDLLIKHGDIAEALVPLLRMRGTEDSFKTVLKKYIPYNYFTTTEALMSSTIQVNTEKDFYDNKQLYDLLLWMKPAGYFLNVSGRKLPIFANNLKALITNRSINKQWVKNMSRYMDPLPGAAFAAPTINIFNGYTIRDKPAYLTFQSDSSFTLRVNDNTKHWDGKLYYSTDTTNWSEWDGTTISSGVDNKLYLRGKGNTKITGASSSSYRWVLTGSNIECIGNIETLLDYETVALGKHPTMADSCYSYMFQNCISLTAAPELPATTLANYCYRNMFYGCTSLTTAPSLPATTLRFSCYENMFRGCASLTTAPSLPATTLANFCYQYMFRDCASLTTVPELPATTLAVGCYRSMFEGCTALKVSTTKTGSYQYSWRIPTSGTGTTATEWNYYMLKDTRGTFTGNPPINKTYYVENPPAPIGDPIGDKPAYLTFQSPSSFTLETANNQKNWNGTLYYSTDTITWNEWDGKTILNSVGNKLYLRGKDNKVITGYSLNSNCGWVLTGSNIECIGNIENLLDYETAASGNHPTMANYCYYAMFRDCTSLTTAPELPATTLADSCYSNMFNGCTSLTTAPSLPATTLAFSCYSNMFNGCTSLTTAPELPATTVVPYCYFYMFADCTSLTTVPELPATTLPNYCYLGMFEGCTALKVSTTKTGSYYYAWRIPTSGTGTATSSYSTRYMLRHTGGTYVGNTEYPYDVSINKTYYVENPPAPFFYPKELYVEFDSKIYEDYKATLQATIEYKYDPRLEPSHPELDPLIIELKSEKTFTNIIPSGDYKTQNISVSLTKPPSNIDRLIIKSIKVTLTPIKQSGTRKASTKIILNKEFSLK